MNINNHIDIKQCEILNGVVTPSLAAFFKIPDIQSTEIKETIDNEENQIMEEVQSDSEQDNEDIQSIPTALLQSMDDDPQIIIKVGFYSPVTIHHVYLGWCRDNASVSPPRQSYLYINQNHLTFADIESQKPVGQFHELGIIKPPLLKSNKVNSILIFIQKNAKQSLPTGLSTLYIVGSINETNTPAEDIFHGQTQRINRNCAGKSGNATFGNDYAE